MSEHDDRPDETPHEAKPEDHGETAVFKPSRWPGMIWAVPIAAIAIVAWLGITAFLNNGPSVTVTFPIAGGLKAGSTKVEYQGFAVGEVGNVTISKSLNSMQVKLNFDATMAGHLGKGTQYWIAGNSVSFSDLSSIKSVISGPHIGIDPHQGHTVGKATGLGQPPVLKDEPKGVTFTLVTPKLSNVSSGSPIYYHGYKVGEIRGVTLEPDGKSFSIFAFIDKQWTDLIDQNTRFWNAGAVHLSTGGTGPTVQIQSVPALVMGAVAFETPDDLPNPKPAHAGEHFQLYDNETAAKDAPGPDAVRFRVVFSGGSHGLQPGAEVKLEGAPVGSVARVRMQYEPSAGEIDTLVTLALQPHRIDLAGKSWNFANPRPQMDEMLTTLIGKGLRAEMTSSVPVVGGQIIDLELVKGQSAGKLNPGNPPQIPAMTGGGDIGQVMSQVNQILATVNAMPLDQIAQNIHSATARLAAVAKSPRTKRTLERLDRTITHVDAMTRETSAQLPAILDQVKRSAAEAQSALSAVRGMLSTEGAANASPDSTDLPHALYELTLAARSLRELTGYLNSHPNSLILGRGH
jgi:paraquat-inducible protein B